MRLPGAEIVVRTLVEQGVDILFGYPGATVIDIYDALHDHESEIRHVLVAHEQGAAHAADGYARATGRVGVCLATSGPGSTNLVTGIATAYMDSIPMVIVTGNVATGQIGTDSFQELDITGVTLPITKHNYFVEDVDELATVMREAFRLAMSGRQGPVLVDIAKDVQMSEGLYEPMPAVQPDPPRHVDPDQVEAAAAYINACHRPLVYVGGGVRSSGAEQDVLELAERVDAPIASSLMGLSCIPSDHARFLGMEGMHGHLSATTAMRTADCIIALGCRFNDRATGDRAKFAPGARVVHVDLDGSEIAKVTHDTYGIIGDVSVAVRELLRRLDRADHRGWRALVGKFRADEERQQDVREGITPRNAMLAVDAWRDAADPVVTDVGQHQMWAAQYLSFSRTRALVTNGGLGTMGFGLPASIGVSLALGRRTLAIVGDGGFGMSLQELATAVSVRAPVTILLMNNGVLGMVRQWQSLFYDRRYASTTLAGYRQTDYVSLAQAFGADGRKVSTIEELTEALVASEGAKGPYLIDCAIDADEMVFPMLAPGGSLDDIIVRSEEQ